jgi:hypothetical protein
MKRFACVLAVVAIVVAASVAQAETISTDTASSSFAVSSTDQPGTGATLAGGGWAGSVANLNNGGGGSLEGGIGAGTGLSSGDYVTYIFDLTNAAYGWNINRITSYASWDTSMGGRTRQGYSVTATLMDNSTVQTLAPQTYVDGTDCYATKVDITGLGLTGVKSLTFSDFVNCPSAGLGNIYHEIDVFGTATVPEPGAVVLLTTGLIGMLSYAWRKRR